jgi:hypothetical protein
MRRWYRGRRPRRRLVSPHQSARCGRANPCRATQGPHPLPGAVPAVTPRDGHRPAGHEEGKLHMSALSRRTFIGGATAGAVAVTVAAAVPGMAAAAPDDTPDDTHELTQPVVHVFETCVPARSRCTSAPKRSPTPTGLWPAGWRTPQPTDPTTPRSHQHVLPPRSTGDLEGSGRRQHRRLRVRQPGPAGHGHADRQLHPAAGSSRRTQLLRVR